MICASKRETKQLVKITGDIILKMKINKKNLEIPKIL
jgi:hypothetical protein